MLQIVSLLVCKETVAVLKVLLQKALRGELRGLALCYWRADGTSQVILSGVYRTRPQHALSAADLIKVTAAHQLDLFA